MKKLVEFKIQNKCSLVKMESFFPGDLPRCQTKMEPRSFPALDRLNRQGGLEKKDLPRDGCGWARRAQTIHSRSQWRAERELRGVSHKKKLIVGKWAHSNGDFLSDRKRGLCRGTNRILFW